MKMFFRIVSYLSLGVCVAALRTLSANETPNERFLLLGGDSASRYSSSTVRSLSMEGIEAPSGSIIQEARGNYKALRDLALFYSDERESIVQENSHLTETLLEIRLKSDALAAVKDNTLSAVMKRMKRYISQANSYLKERGIIKETQEADDLTAQRKKAADQCNALYDLAKFYYPPEKVLLLERYPGQKEENVETILRAEALRAVRDGAVLSLLDRLNRFISVAETNLIALEEQNRSLSRQTSEPPFSPVPTVKADQEPVTPLPVVSQLSLQNSSANKGGQESGVPQQQNVGHSLAGGGTVEGEQTPLLRKDQEAPTKDQSQIETSRGCPCTIM